MEENENPLDRVLGMAAQMNQVQFNAAKLTISWKMYNHIFTVESMNPVSAFEMARKVKEVAVKEFGKNGKKE